MKIKCFVFNPVQVNTYLVWDEQTLDALIIDAGMFNQAEEHTLTSFLESNGLTLKRVLQTHMHFDHIFGINYLHRKYALSPVAHPLEQELYSQMPDMALRFGIQISPQLLPLQSIHDGELIPFSNTQIQVLHTPGHTPGGVCYHFATEGVLFCGDTLFAGSIGRTDLPGGDYRKEIESIRNRLMVLPAETRVYPGHGPATTIGSERENNPYLM